MSHRAGPLPAWCLLLLMHVSWRSFKVTDISGCGGHTNIKSSSLLVIFSLCSHEGVDLPKEKICLKGLQLPSTPALINAMLILEEQSHSDLPPCPTQDRTHAQNVYTSPFLEMACNSQS